MTRKNIDTSREIRLWTGIIGSALTTGVILASNPYLRCKVRKMKNDVKAKIREWKNIHSKNVEIINNEGES